MSTSPDAVAIIDALKKSLKRPTDLDETLLEVTRAAVDHLPGVDAASISTRRRDGSLATNAATNGDVHRADLKQYELRQGPCYNALMDYETHVSPDCAVDSRWPEYGVFVSSLSFRSQAGLPLYHYEHGAGVLNLYSASTGSFQDSQHLHDLFVSQAVSQLAFAQEIAELQQAMESRKVIGQAIGIFMERYQISEERAFAFLARTSQTSNVKLRYIAAEVVSHFAGKGAKRHLDG